MIVRTTLGWMADAQANDVGNDWLQEQNSPLQLVDVSVERVIGERTGDGEGSRNSMVQRPEVSMEVVSGGLHEVVPGSVEYVEEFAQDQDANDTTELRAFLESLPDLDILEFLARQVEREPTEYDSAEDQEEGRGVVLSSQNCLLARC